MTVVSDDVDIMRRVQQGEVEEFDRLVLRYRDRLFRVAQSKLGDRAWAEDVVQEAFMAAYASRQTYKPQFAFRTWLWTILINLCRRQLKRKSRRPQEVVHSVLEQGSVGNFPEPVSDEGGLQQILRSERRDQVWALLSRLPEVQADALRLRFFGGLKFEEISQTMGCSLSAAKVRVRNGLLTLSRQLRDAQGERPDEL